MEGLIPRPASDILIAVGPPNPDLLGYRSLEGNPATRKQYV